MNVKAACKATRDVTAFLVVVGALIAIGWWHPAALAAVFLVSMIGLLWRVIYRDYKRKDL